MNPLWSPDGKELFDRNGETAMAVSVETDSIFRLGTLKKLFDKPYTAWDIHPDGERFLMMKPFDVATPEEGSPKPKIVIVRNWFEELKQRVPVD